MIVKIFSASNIDDLEKQIQDWLDDIYDPTDEIQIVSVTQSEGDGIVNVTIIVK